MNKSPFLKLQNGEILHVGDIKHTPQGELTIQKFSYGFDIASRTSIINHLIHKYKLDNYLEIGVRDGRNFDKIFINKKISDLNIQNIENIKMDTFTAQETFYSHRRSRLNNEKDYGRCISVILMT